MKKIVFILMVVFLNHLFGIEIINEKNESIKLNMNDLTNFNKISFSTHREKNNKVQDDQWEGYLLMDILKKNNVTSFDLIEVNSMDNYQIKLSYNDVVEHQPILAISRNQKPLEENQLRIVAPKLRDMYWASDIKTIKCVSQTVYPFVNQIYPFSYLKKQLHLQDEPQPFKNVKGYYFNDMINLLNITIETPLKITTTDSLTMELEYESFLEKAVLILNDDQSIDIKSPTMPGGMWQKKIKTIQLNNIIIYFDNQNEIYDQELLKKTLSLDNTNQINVAIDPSIKEFNIKKIMWNSIELIEIK